MTDLTSLTIAEARDKLAAKDFTATELTDAYLAAIDTANEALNAYVKVTPEKARDMAKASDERIAAGRAGALEGIPLGVKDLYATEGVHTQACSHVLDGFEPRYESTVTANLWNDGAVMLGKLNMDEFAMGSSNETSYYGPVKNPWRAKGSNRDLVPGGSSGGSASAVAAHLCAGATASDTGGSIRQPAAFTGTVGIKPTYGRCSRWGMVAFASSLDQAGPIARDVRDAAIMLKSMASVDDKDTTSVDLPVPDYEAASAVREGHEDRHSGRIPHGRHARRDRNALAAGHRLAEGCRRGDRRHLAAAHQIRAAGLLHRRAGGSLVQPGAL
jgi:aspartyl-tRNA(Asn)/glutamyl-tRNA(Gln) amidotransferase subunit A